MSLRRQTSKIGLGEPIRVLRKTFYTASIFFEILNQFGQLQPDKQKYAAWKAADISKALKEVRKPVPGPPGGDNDLSSTPKAGYDIEPSRTDPDTKPAPIFDPSTQAYDKLEPKQSSNIPPTPPSNIPPISSSNITPSHPSNIPPSTYPTNDYPSQNFLRPPPADDYPSHNFHQPPPTDGYAPDNFHQPP